MMIVVVLFLDQKTIEKSKHPYFAKIKGYILPRSRAVDVNDKEDFELVRKLFKVK